MSEEVTNILTALIGLNLSTTSRAANMECLKFGTTSRLSKKRDRMMEVGEFGLHIQCPWHLRDAEKIIVASNDIFEPANENQAFDENFDWDKANANLRDVKLSNFLIQFQPIVISCKADVFGGLEINFETGIQLFVFPDASKIDCELWRLIDNRTTPSTHLVRYTKSFEL